MSYILDALKRAESERERGVVPGLGSAQTSQSTYISYGSSHKPVWLVALALGALVAAAAAIWAWRQAVVQAPAAPVAAAPVAVPAPAATPSVPPRVAQASAEPVAVAVVRPVPALAEVAPQAATKAAVPMPAASAARSTVVPVIAKAAGATPGPLAPTPGTPGAVGPASPTASPTEAATKAPPAPAAVARAAPSAVVPLGELPESVRRQIPPLAISGAIYSDAPPEWTLIINDQVLGKGSQVAPDLRLEEISASSAVFNFKGQRFRVDR